MSEETEKSETEKLAGTINGAIKILMWVVGLWIGLPILYLLGLLAFAGIGSLVQ